MFPSTLLGLLALVLLSAPGLAYVLRHERVVPAPALSAFRESLRVIFASVVALTTAGLLFAGVRWLMPQHTLDVRGLVLKPAEFARGHHVQLTWWFLAYLATATLLGAVAADPRIIDRWQQVREKRWYRLLTGRHDGQITADSGWTRAITTLYNGNDGTWIGAALEDGTYVEGNLAGSSTSTREDDNRDLVLCGPFKVTAADGTPIENHAQLMVISAKRIMRLDITHLFADSAASPEAPSSVEIESGR